MGHARGDRYKWVNMGHARDVIGINGSLWDIRVVAS